MTLRRLLPLLAMLALLAAPFGRMAAAEAIAMPAHGAAAAGHCDDMPTPDRDKGDRAVDCLVACAAMAAPDGFAPHPRPSTAAAPAASPVAGIAGLHPEADPPPPRFS